MKLRRCPKLGENTVLLLILLTVQSGIVRISSNWTAKGFNCRNILPLRYSLQKLKTSTSVRCINYTPTRSSSLPPNGTRLGARDLHFNNCNFFPALGFATDGGIHLTASWARQITPPTRMAGGRAARNPEPAAPLRRKGRKRPPERSEAACILGSKIFWKTMRHVRSLAQW
jgi:hypothetical protein